MRHRTETNLNLLKRKHQHRSYHDGLDHDATPAGLRKAVSGSVPSLVCKYKRRRTEEWQQHALSTTTNSVANYRASTSEQPMALAQLLFRKKSTDSRNKNSSAPTKTAQAISEVLQTLRTLTSSATCQNDSARDAAVLTMKRFPFCLPLQREGCLALRRYLKASSIEGGGLTADCLEALLRALICYSGPGSYLQHLVIDCLRIAARGAKGRLLMAERNQCIDLVLRTLRAFSLDSRLQELGLSLISFLVEDEACRKLIIKHGGVSVIVRSMKNHDTNALIQCNASAALGWLIHLDHAKAKEALLATENAILVILGICRRYVENASVFGNCVCILCGVRVGDRAVAETYPDLGSPTRQLLQLGMQKNRTALKVQRNCMMLLRLTTESLGETETLDDAKKESYEECIRVVVTCMKDFPNECEIQSFACRVLCNLSARSETRALVMEGDGCINQVVRALDKHKGDAGVLQGACWFLQAILHAGVETQAGATAFGGGLSVLRIMLLGLGVKVVANPADP